MLFTGHLTENMALEEKHFNSRESDERKVTMSWKIKSSSSLQTIHGVFFTVTALAGLSLLKCATEL